MHSRGCSHRCTSIRCAHTFSASHLRFSGSVCSLRGDVQRPPSPAAPRTSVEFVCSRTYAPTVALRHSCLFLSLREPLSPSLLVHSATRRPTAAHQPSPPLSTTVLAEPQISPSLRSRRASDLAEPHISPSSSRLRCRRASSFASASSAPTRTLATTSCAIVC